MDAEECLKQALLTLLYGTLFGAGFLVYRRAKYKRRRRHLRVVK